MIKSTQAEKGCSWHPIFRSDNDNGVGPSEPMQENFRQAPYASLVRESIQNSLDVRKRNSTEPVELRYSIGSIDSNNFPKFFEINRHIQGCINNFPNNDKAKKIYPPMLAYINKVNRPGGKLHFIRVSDYNTQGMPYTNLDDNDSPFYAFVRSAGVSSKADESAGGSFGFGKAAYFYLSPLRTVLVSTKTEDNKYFFEGVCSLCSHKIDGRTVSNIVYYDNNDGNPTTSFEDVPGRFQRKDEDGNEVGSGTDIFIMGVDFDNVGTEEEIYEEMFLATLENFWMAILDNKLVVRIGKGKKERIIDSSNIKKLMEDNFDENDNNKRRKRGVISKYNPRPYFDAVNLADGSNEKFIHRVIDLGHNEKLRAIQTLPLWGKAHFYFAKNKQANNRIVYMRGLRMTVSISPARNGEGYYGVIICPDGESNSWLRKMENPAHSTWDYKRLETKHDRRIAKTLLEAIEEEKNKIIREIFNLDAIETVKIKGLEQYLYIPSEADEDDDNDGVSSPIGEPTGKFLDTGFSPTTNTDKIRSTSIISNSTLLGSVLFKQSGSISPDETGTTLTGRGNTRIKKPNTNKHVSSAQARQRNKVSDSNNDSHSLEPILVKYRSFAQIIDGTVVHRLVLTNDIGPVDKGQIDLLIGGESSDSKISISYSSNGEIMKNSITNLNLPLGKTTIEIRFADNMEHSLKIASYEVK